MVTVEIESNASMKKSNKAQNECDKHQPLCIDNGECPYYFEEENESCIVLEILNNLE